MLVGLVCDYKMCVLLVFVIYGEYIKFDKFYYMFKIYLESKFYWELYVEIYIYSVYV